MQIEDKGKVKFQNAFIYFDMMYGIYKNVIRLSNNSSEKNIKSLRSYYEAITELFYFVEPFLKENNLVFYYKSKLNKIINDNKLSSEYIITLKLNKKSDLLDTINEKTSLSDYLDLIKRRIILCESLPKSQERIKKLRLIKEMLHISKRNLAYEMKINKLTVPINNYDPSRAITEGY